MLDSEDKCNGHPIRMVERDTGIGRDTLRIWERRYGFPCPQRNAQGERVYTTDQVRRLQRIRRLLDQGLRPGKLLVLDDRALAEVEAKLSGSHRQAEIHLLALIDTILTTDKSQLESMLEQDYVQRGMHGFILETVAPLLHLIGEKWAQGALQIYHEHFTSAVLLGFLGARMASLPVPTKSPPVLLTTLPGEKHILGLIMVAALLIDSGKSTVYLGPELPMDQIVNAVKQFRAGIIGLTFSEAYTYKHIHGHLQELRGQLPDNVEIWIGGKATQRLRKLPAGIRKISNLNELNS